MLHTVKKAPGSPLPILTIQTFLIVLSLGNQRKYIPCVIRESFKHYRTQ